VGKHLAALASRRRRGLIAGVAVALLAAGGGIAHATDSNVDGIAHPSGIGTVFVDDFDGAALDPVKWDLSVATAGYRFCTDTPGSFDMTGSWLDPASGVCHGSSASPPYGSIVVNGGIASFSSPANIRNFPYVWTKTPVFPATGDFILTVRMRFDSRQSNGTFVSAVAWTPSIVGNSHPESNSWVFQIRASGANLFLGQDVGPVDTAMHTYVLEYVGGQYTLKIDGTVVAGPVESTLRPTAIMLGNPLFDWWTGGDDWTDFSVDLIQVIGSVVDTTPPETSIDSQPSALTRLTSAIFTFSANEPGTFECQLDGGGWETCTSPKDYADLADGSHTFQVRATDAAGNTDASPAGFTWTIDTTPPPAPTAHATPAPNAAGWNNTDVTVSFSANGDTGGSGVASCTADQHVTSETGTGGTTLSGTCTDEAGNQSAQTLLTVRLDKTPPQTTITSGPANPTRETSASFSFTGADSLSGLAGFQCRLDGAAWAACTSPVVYPNLAKRSHLFETRAVDLADNPGATPAQYAWTNGTKPKPKILTSPHNPANQATADFTFSSSDPGASYQCSLDGGAFTTCTSPKIYAGLGEGPHSFAVNAVDAAGRQGKKPASYRWTVDTTPPDTTITGKPLATTDKTQAQFKLASTEKKSTLQCSLDGSPFAACKSTVKYKNLTAGNHTFRARATDAAGNTDPTPATFIWTITS
jgi:Big-like domain-containing protein